MNERVLVTGAAGFLGHHLLAQLEGRGRPLTGTYLKESPGRRRLPFVKYVPLNMLHLKEVNDLFLKLKPDWVFHLAAMTIPRQSWNNIEGTFEANVRGTLNILEAARLQKKPPRLFFASTIQVYGQSFYQKGALDESAVVWPESPYAASKAVAELAVLDYVSRFKLDAVIGRFANSIGRGQPSALVFPEWCRQIAQIESGRVEARLQTGNLNVERDFLHAGDAANAMLAIMKKGQSGKVYNVASGKTVRLKSYADYLLRSASVKIKLQSAAALRAKKEPKKMAIQCRKLKQLGWKPSRSVEMGLDELLDEWRVNEAG